MVQLSILQSSGFELSSCASTNLQKYTDQKQQLSRCYTRTCDFQPLKFASFGLHGWIRRPPPRIHVFLLPFPCPLFVVRNWCFVSRKSTLYAAGILWLVFLVFVWKDEVFLPLSTKWFCHAFSVRLLEPLAMVCQCLTKKSRVPTRPDNPKSLDWPWTTWQITENGFQIPGHFFGYANSFLIC